MTPTEQDKELRSKSYKLAQEYLSADNLEGFVDLIQNNLTLDEAMQLITADRKRVASEARRNEALIADRNLGQYPDYHKMKTASLKRIDDIERGCLLAYTTSKLNRRKNNGK